MFPSKLDKESKVASQLVFTKGSLQKSELAGQTGQFENETLVFS